LSGKEVTLLQKHRKHSLRTYLIQWHKLRSEIHNERENMDMAIKHHTRRVRVTCKLLIYKWRKLVKDSAKEIVEKLARFDLIKTRCIVDTWKLMVIKRHCEKMREKYFKRKAIQSFRLAQSEKAEMNKYKNDRMKLLVFLKWRTISRCNKSLRARLEEWNDYARLVKMRQCFDGLQDVIKILKKAKGDPFLLRSIIGNFTKQQKCGQPLDYDDETEFFEIQVRSQSQIINEPDFSNNNYLSNFIEVDVLGLDQHKTLNLMYT
jgi:hypothetical protein